MNECKAFVTMGDGDISIVCQSDVTLKIFHSLSLYIT